MNSCLNAQSVRQEFVCQKDAATLLGRSVSWVQKQDRAGTFVPKYRVGRAAMYRADDIRSWMERHAVVAG
jgi:hypothetical protein